MQSEILFSAKEKDSLDWNTIKRLVDDNRNFKMLLDEMPKGIRHNAMFDVDVSVLIWKKYLRVRV
ncbi:hypothetical protein K040078D81_08400 [Blautia hominis]|uniref:Uncharacterized protein n=1 Tax=Blautia hominis TaxID=2025493 RepID=A0ABQ0B5M1_9FIRM